MRSRAAQQMLVELSASVPAAVLTSLPIAAISPAVAPTGAVETVEPAPLAICALSRMVLLCPGAALLHFGAAPCGIFGRMPVGP